MGGQQSRDENSPSSGALENRLGSSTTSAGLSLARIDLHCHTSYSEDREQIELPGGLSMTVPFHPTLRPAQVYDLALSRGMTHVTFTDHNTLAGCLELLAGPHDSARLITGEEVTCYHRAPNSTRPYACVHVGVFGLTEDDHAQIHAGCDSVDREKTCLRWNLPQLIEFCEGRGLAVELKHPLWASGSSSPKNAPGSPTVDRETLVDTLSRFRLVEAINGSRHPRLNNLGRQLASEMAGRLGVAFTAGSDSHTDNVGVAYTQTFGESPAEVLAELRAGHCQPAGEHGTHRRLDHDSRACVLSNATGRAGHFVALADDYLHNMPLEVQDLLSISVSAAVAYGVVAEYARQRRLADEVRALFPELASSEDPAEHSQDPQGSRTKGRG